MFFFFFFFFFWIFKLFWFFLNYYFSDIGSGVGLWLEKTYQYGCHLSVLSHRAPGTAECDESYCIKGDHIWASGECFYHESYCDVVMTIYEFQIFVTSVPGVGRGICPYRHRGGVYPYMGPSIPPLVFGLTKMP